MKRTMSALVACTAVAMTVPASAGPLRPHQAVYDLSLSGQTEDILAVEGRIALTLNARSCGEYDLDYRFAARFHKDGETTLTDQRTRSVEADHGRAYRFETTTFVDGLDQGTVKGTASNGGNATTVSMEEPVVRSFSLPASHFPLDHTAMLIDRARQGQRFVEARLFDGDPEAEKLMTTTSIILPAAAGASRDAGRDLAGLASWTVDESYFNSDSDEDGLPIFRARYRLYENGVSDDMTLDFGDYALRGRLSSLTYLATPDCP